MHGLEFLLFLQRIPTRLEVIKITGDPNVQRGEYSIVAPHLDDSRISGGPEFQGSAVVMGFGQIAETHFRNPQFTEVEGKSQCSHAEASYPILS